MAKARDPAAELEKLEKAIDKAEASLGGLGDKLDTANVKEQRAGKALDDLVAQFVYLSQNAKVNAGALDALSQKIEKAQNKLTDASAGSARAFDAFSKKEGELRGLRIQQEDVEAEGPAQEKGGGIGKTLGTLAAAAGGATLAFGAAAAAVVPFVQAFAPAEIQVLTQALTDLAAVVGSALTPVMHTLTTIARQVGAVLYPIMQQLAPVIAQLTGVLESLILPLIDVWGTVLQSLVPVIVVVGDLLSNLGTYFRAAGAILTGVVEQLRQWITALLPAGEDVKSFTDYVRDAFQEVAKAAVILAGYLARLVGATGFLDGLIKSLSGAGIAKRVDVTGLGAPSQARITTIPDFEKQALAAAFTATGGGPAKTQEKWLEEAVGALQAIQKGQADNVTDLGQWLKWLPGIVDQVKDLAQEVRAIKKTVEDALGGAGDVAGKALDHLSHPNGWARPTAGAVTGAANALNAAVRGWLFPKPGG